MESDMRSAETSGVSATGFGAFHGQKAKGRAGSSVTTPAASPFRRVSPIVIAVAVTSALAASLFVIYDTARTLADADRNMVAAARLQATEISQDAVTTSSGIVAASMLSPRAVEASVAPGAFAAVDQADAEMWMGIGQRSAAAFGLAGLAMLVVARRRRDDMPDMVQRHNYQTLAAAIPLGVACWTKSGKLIVCNEQYRSRLDLSPTTVNYADAIKRLTMGGYIKLVNEDEGSKMLELHREDGSCLLIDERPLGDGAIMTLVSDVTEAKRTDTMLHAIRQEQRLLARRYHEEKLKAEAASRSKTHFLAHLSHDIRTPLNHIIGFAELMKHQTYGPLGDARYGEYVQSIKASGEHLLASFATILDLAELESGQKVLRNDPVPIDELLDSTVARFRSQAGRAGILFVQGESCHAVVRGDRLGLTRMIDNIIENALRFTPSGGRITLNAYAARDGVVIEITDTGVGMSEKRLASLSQPFALGDATFTREGTGPGLGISISRAIAEQSGGNLVIDSSPALGTTVAISLPLPALPNVMAA
jgi:two-component system cell cycle sensor histidine kinase PleC